MFLILYITNPDEATAQKIGQHLVKNKYVACANIFPIKSVYWWQGKIESEGEYVTIVKTRTENKTAVIKETERIHPYEVPCIMHWEVAANPAYENWIFSETEQKL